MMEEQNPTLFSVSEQTEVVEKDFPNENNLMIGQSMELTFLGGDFSVSQRRILYEVLKACQYIYKGVNVSRDKFNLLDFSNMLGTEYVIPIRSIFPGNYSQQDAKDCVTGVAGKIFTHLNREGGIVAENLFTRAEIMPKSGSLAVEMSSVFYKYLSNIQRGITFYDYNVVKNFSSKYAMKMFEIISRGDLFRDGQRRFKVTELRRLLGVDYFDTIKDEENKNKRVLKSKYKKPAEFEREVLNVAKEQFDDPKYKSPYTFSYTRDYDDHKNLYYVIQITCIEKYLTNSDQEYRRNKVVERTLQGIHEDVLRKLQTLDWSIADLMKNANLLKNASKFIPKDEMIEIISQIYCLGRERKVDDPVLYMVGGLRKQLEKRNVNLNIDGTINEQSVDDQTYNDDPQSQYFNFLAESLGDSFKLVP